MSAIDIGLDYHIYKEKGPEGGIGKGLSDYYKYLLHASKNFQKFFFRK